MTPSPETRKKISETLKRKGIKPSVLPTREQCIANLRNGSRDTWNKGKKGAQVAWNKGKEYGAIKGEKNPKWNGGKSNCIDCGNKLTSYRKNSRCSVCHKLFNKGKNHPLWKGGGGNPVRKTILYKKWRMEVYRRDWFSCQMPFCLYHGKDIEAHHIVTVKKNVDRVYDVKNGITLCRKCHLSIRNKEKDYENLFNKILEFRLP